MERLTVALCLSTVLALAPVPRASPAAAAAPSVAERSQSLVETLREEWGAPVVSAAVAVDGAVVFAGAAGRVDGDGSPADVRTRFRIASVSKAITGVLMLRLAEEGLVDLDAPVHRVLEELPESVRGITPRQLLAHTSGIRHYQRGETSHKTEHFESPLAALETVLAEPLRFEPGTAHGYTTYGYTLLQAVAEAVTGLGFEEALRAFVFEPAGMDRTSLDRAGEETSRATGFQRVGTEEKAVPPDDVSFKYAGGGMASNPSDLVRLCAALDRGELLEPGSRETLLTPAYPELDAEQSLGFAVERELTTGLLRLWHPGRGNGFEAYLVCYPEERVAAAVATNQDWTDPWDEVGRAARTLARLHLPAIHLYRTPPQVLERRLEALAEEGRLEEAVSAYRSYREEIDGLWEAGLEVHRLAERLSARGKLEAAAALYTANVEAFPESWHTQLALAGSRLRIGDLEGAARALEAARPLVPGPDVVEPLASRIADLREPPVASPAGEYALVLEGTALVEHLPATLRVFQEDDGRLQGEARSPVLGELPVIRSLAGGPRLWVALASPHGLVELDLLRTEEGVEGRWQVGSESGPLRGTGPAAPAAEEDESPPTEPVG